MRILGAIPFIVAASCGGVIATSDGGNDAGGDVLNGTKCNSAADCPSGYECAYPLKGGCQAARQCFPPAPECKNLIESCSCAGPATPVMSDCNDAFPQPVMGMPCEHVCTGPSCEVCDVTGFQPYPQTPPFASLNTCSPSQISDLVTACSSSTSTQTTCDAWKTTNAGPCASCAVTSTTSNDWGPIVCDANGTCTLNEGGCVDLTLKEVALEKSAGGSGSCGDAYSDELACLAYACGACSSADSTTCSKSAVANECASYVAAAKTSPMCGGLDATACFPQSTADMAPFINVFCGTGP